MNKRNARSVLGGMCRVIIVGLQYNLVQQATARSRRMKVAMSSAGEANCVMIGVRQRPGSLMVQ